MDDLKKPTFWLWLITALLIGIVAVGQWSIYPRLEQVENGRSACWWENSERQPGFVCQ